MCLKKSVSQRNSLHCIVPPHMLNALARAGEAKWTKAAVSTLSHDSTLRALRGAGNQVIQELVGTPLKGARYAAAAPQKDREIYDAANGTVLPGKLVRSEGGAPVGDAAVDEAYDGLGHTYDFYLQEFGRSSLDDQGSPLIGSVHYSQDYQNAFWDGTQMVFGDGDGEIFNRFTIALDVIGHELTHAVTEDEAGLVYLYQPGALNESISDVFGSMIKQWTLKQDVESADWLIGAGLLGKTIKGKALRSMKDPGTAYDDPLLGKDPQPAHMNDYVNTSQDNGGVHINSGIPNKAFYLVCSKLGGYSWGAPGKIWYETLRDSRLKKTTGFQRFARLTLDVARANYGANSNEQAAVKEAWNAVGIAI